MNLGKHKHSSTTTTNLIKKKVFTNCQVLKQWLLKCCTQYASKFGKFSSGHKTGKDFIPIPKKGNAKECSNYHTIALISHASKAVLKILQSRLQQYMNCELPDVQVRFRKGRGTGDQIADICWIIQKSKRVPEKHLLLLCWLCQGLWLCGSQLTVENSSRDGIPGYLTCLLRNLYAGSRNNS